MATLKKLWHAWKRVGQAIGDAIASVVLTLFYFTLFLPFGLGVRLFADPLEMRPGQTARWVPRDQAPAELDAARRLG